MHRYADGGVTEEFETDDFDVAAELERINAEGEAAAAAATPPEPDPRSEPGTTAGRAGIGGYGAPAVDDWEELP